MLFTIAIFIGLIAVLIVGHEFGHFLLAKLFKLRVDEFAFGFPPRLISKRVRETKYSLNLIPLGGFVKIYGETADAGKEHIQRSFYHQAAWKRFLVIFAGVVMNFLIGWAAFSAIFISGVPHKVYIDEVAPGSPAEAAGFKPGEELRGFETPESFSQFVKDNAGKEILINDKQVTPRVNPPLGEGALGVAVSDAYVAPRGFFASVRDGFFRTVETLGSILVGLGRIIMSLFSGGDLASQVSGPVGIFKVVGGAADLGFIYILNLLGLLSLNLAVFNLLPVPALDGGRLLFIGLEKLLGRRLNPMHENVANLIGFALLMLLAVTVTINDVLKLTR